jgi:predicted enzyme related to lactoylglutathione lyase
MATSQHYTDKRTTVFASRARSLLDRAKAAELASRTMITHIKFVSVPVRDQNRALDFYTEKLGFTIITDQPFDEKQRWIELRIPKAETRVVLFTPEGQEDRVGSFSPLVFACADVEETYAELKKRGVVFDGPPEKQPWGTFAKFRDSEDNQFVLGTPK